MTPPAFSEPDRYATCPHAGRVLDFYDGVFEAVYVLLHPFIRLVSMSKDEYESARYPNRVAIRRCCEPVFWSEMQRRGGFASLAEIDVALRTQILGLKKKFCDEALAARLRATADIEGVVEPSEGTFCELTDDIVLKFIGERGYDQVWVGDQFGTRRTLHRIEDLRKDDAVAIQGAQCSVFTPDHKLLWTTHWDSHFSFFCGTAETIADMAKETDLEGFVCDGSTEVYWSLR